MFRSFALATFLVFSCGRRTSETYVPPEVAFSMRGTVKLAPLPTGMSQESLAYGRVNIRLFATNEEGFCLLGGSAVLADVVSAVTMPDARQALDQGQSFHFAVLLAPGMRFPLTVYPVAEWQTTRVREHICEDNSVTGVDRYNARGAYMPAGESVCCDAFPSPVIVANQGDVADNVHFTLQLRTNPAPTCADSSLPNDRCVLKGGACWTALGARAGEIIRQPNGDACE